MQKNFPVVRRKSLHEPSETITNAAIDKQTREQAKSKALEKFISENFFRNGTQETSI